ncbi:MAG: hypothetical protein DRG87_00295 [Deltaproteobacteria bacterium]|nr:MAG: hypothetical protein DRG87_00295 [Deltaproteobacteria bacterium]
MFIALTRRKPPWGWQRKSVKRISLTLPVLTNARRIIFLVTGSEKAGAVREIVEDSESRLPASLVKLMTRSVYLVMDDGAASLLSHTRARI